MVRGGCDVERGAAQGAEQKWQRYRDRWSGEDVVSLCMALSREVVRALAVMRRSMAEGVQMVEAQHLVKLRIDRAFDQAMGAGAVTT